MRFARRIIISVSFYSRFPPSHLYRRYIRYIFSFFNLICVSRYCTTADKEMRDSIYISVYNSHPFFFIKLRNDDINNTARTVFVNTKCATEKGEFFFIVQILGSIASVTVYTVSTIVYLLLILHRTQRIRAHSSRARAHLGNGVSGISSTHAHHTINVTVCERRKLGENKEKTKVSIFQLLFPFCSSFYCSERANRAFIAITSIIMSHTHAQISNVSK